MHRENGRNGDVLGDVAKGTIAGLAATMAMGKVTHYWFQHEDPQARKEYQEVTGGKYPPQRTAEFIEQTLNLHPSKKQHKMLAKGSHQAVGIGAGVAYALARRKIGWADAGQGLLFGALFSLIFDEGLTPLVGFAEPPQEYPWQAHARGLVGHLAFGLAAETVLDGLDAVA
jgi:hypothetical protein